MPRRARELRLPHHEGSSDNGLALCLRLSPSLLPFTRLDALEFPLDNLAHFLRIL
jgi:hypothetical protein